MINVVSSLSGNEYYTLQRIQLKELCKNLNERKGRSSGSYIDFCMAGKYLTKAFFRIFLQ